MPNSLAAFEAALDAQQDTQAGAAPRLLSVTECLPFTADRDSPAMIAARERGTAVHTATEMHDRDTPHDPGPDIHGYLAAWRNFVSTSGAQMVEIELRVGGDALGYVGTLDRVALIDGKPWILDIKTGRPWPTHAVQTAAYEHAFREMHSISKKKKIRRACVHLRSDGSYLLHEHADPNDYSVFLAYRRIALWEISVGLREQPTGRY